MTIKNIQPVHHFILELQLKSLTLEDFSQLSGISMERLCQPFFIDLELARACQKVFNTNSFDWLKLQHIYNKK